MGLYDSTNNFINAIKSTREFNELIQSKSILERNPQLKSEVIGFNRKLRDIYTSSKSASEVDARLSELNRQSGSLFRMPDVDRYVKALKPFNEMMFKLYQSINDSIEAELRFR